MNWVIDQVKQSGGIDYAIEKMHDYRQQALDILSGFPENEIRKGLEDMLRYVTDRKY